MSWNELSESLSFVRTKKKVVVHIDCERCLYWLLRRGIKCRDCRREEE